MVGGWLVDVVVRGPRVGGGTTMSAPGVVVVVVADGVVGSSSGTTSSTMGSIDGSSGLARAEVTT